MKKNLLLSIFFVFTSSFAGFCQSGDDEVQLYKDIPKHTKGEAISILQDNYLFRYFRSPEDTIGNINMLIDNIGNIVTIDTHKRNELKIKLRTQVMRGARGTRNSISTETWTINGLLWNLPYQVVGFIPFMGGNADNLIKSSFNEADYNKIYTAITNERAEASYAYQSLRTIYTQMLTEERGEIVIMSFDLKKMLDKVYDEYDM